MMYNSNKIIEGIIMQVDYEICTRHVANGNDAVTNGTTVYYRPRSIVVRHILCRS